MEGIQTTYEPLLENLEKTDAEKQPKKRIFTELTDELKKLCLLYIDKRNYSEKTRLLYGNQIHNIFSKTILTQTYYNEIYDKGNFHKSVLKIINLTLEHNDLPAYKYKTIPQITKPRKIPQVWTESEVLRIASYHPIDIGKLMINCSYFIGAGLRFESTIYLRWNDFNWEDWLLDQEKAGTCFIHGKRDKEATLPVDKVLMKKLYDYAKSNRRFMFGQPSDINNDQFIFIDKYELKKYMNEAKAKKWNKENIEASDIKTRIDYKQLGRVILTKKFHDRFNYQLKKISKNDFNNVKIKFHSFRSSRATNLLKKGFSIVEIKDLLMHSSIQTTQIYLNLSNMDLQNKFNQIMN